MKRIFITMLSSMLLLLSGSLIWNSCRKDDDILPKDFDSIVRSLPYPFATDYMTKPLPLSRSTQQSGSTLCTTVEYEYAPGFSEAILLDPTTDVIAPGMLLEPNTLGSGNYTPITEAKAPIMISHSQGGGVSVENPSLSTIRGAMQQLNQNASVNPANFTYESELIQSSQQLMLAVKGHYKNPWATVNTGFNWNSSSTKSRLYAKFVQVYYTIDVDHAGKNNPSDWFEKLPDPKSWNATPVYVSSVKYGRIGIVTIESQASQEELNAYFEATFSAFSQTGGLEIGAEHQQTHNQSTYKAFVVGGDPNIAVKSINDFAGFKEWITSSAQFTPQSPGSPVAYTLRYLKNNEVATIVLSGKYSLTTCMENVYEIRLTPEFLGPFYPVMSGGGDGDFEGNGPMQNASVTLIKDALTDTLRLHVNYHLKETKPNWTEAEYDAIFALNPYYPDSIKALFDQGWVVDKVISAPQCRVKDKEFSGSTYQIVTKGDDSKEHLVYKFHLLGDTAGRDVWPDVPGGVGDCKPGYSDEHGCSNMKIELNPIWVTFKQK
jgi:thiol-activated cytolysin